MNHIKTFMRMSDSETYVMTAVGLDKALEEFLGPRADAASTKLHMYNQISTYGYCSLKDLEPYKDITQNQTVNTISTYLLGAGIENDLLDESYKFKGDE